MGCKNTTYIGSRGRGVCAGTVKEIFTRGSEWPRKCPQVAPVRAQEKRRMAITVSVYDTYYSELQQGNIDWLNDKFTATLHTAESFVASETNFTHISAEITDADYSEQVITNPAIVITSNVADLDCDNINYGSNVTITAAMMVIRKDTGTDADDILCFHVDFGGSQSSTSSNFRYDIHATGLSRVGANGF